MPERGENSYARQLVEDIKDEDSREIAEEWFKVGDEINRIVKDPYTAPELKKRLIESVDKAFKAIVKQIEAARKRKLELEKEKEKEAIPMPEAEEEVAKGEETLEEKN